MHSRSGRVHQTSCTHDCKKRRKSGLILSYFFFSAASFANLAFMLIATEPPPLGEDTVPRDG